MTLLDTGPAFDCWARSLQRLTGWRPRTPELYLHRGPACPAAGAERRGWLPSLARTVIYCTSARTSNQAAASRVSARHPLRYLVLSYRLLGQICLGLQPRSRSIVLARNGHMPAIPASGIPRRPTFPIPAPASHSRCLRTCTNTPARRTHARLALAVPYPGQRARAASSEQQSSRAAELPAQEREDLAKYPQPGIGPAMGPGPACPESGRTF